MRPLMRPIIARPKISASVLVLVVLVGVGAFWWNGRGSKAAAAPAYRLVAASTGTIKQSLSSTGTIEPAIQDALNFAVSGQVTSVGVTAGQAVAAGTVLATVDSAALKANLAQAQASLATDQAKLTNDTNAGGSATQLAADNASITAALGQLASAQSALAQASLTSPIAGVVASVNLTVGAQVSGSSGSGSGSGSGSSGFGGGSASASASSGSSSSSSTSASSAQFLVISTDSWIVNATVDDTQVGLLATGDQAQITASGATGTVFGTVSSIGLIAQSSSGVASYPVVIKVTGSPAGLHAGATGTVSMIYKQLSNVLTIPSTAVHLVNGQSVVYQIAGGKQVAHSVTTGLSSGGSTQITAGLTEGTQVVVELPRTTTRTGGTGNTGGRTGFGGTGGAFGGTGGAFGGAGGGFGGAGGGFGGARTGGGTGTGTGGR